MIKKKIDIKKEDKLKRKKILPPKKGVRFFQVENKLDAIINFELAGGIPLVPAAK